MDNYWISNATVVPRCLLYTIVKQMVRKTTLRKCFEVETTKNCLKKSKTLSSTKAIRTVLLGSPLIGYMTHKKAHLEFVCKTKPGKQDLKFMMVIVINILHCKLNLVSRPIIFYITSHTHQLKKHTVAFSVKFVVRNFYLQIEVA